MSQDVLEIQEGIWIHKQWIRDAGLGQQGQRLQVIIQPGEIRIVPVPMDVEESESAKGWELFRTLGNDAQPGQLPEAAADHDRYLYGKGS